MTDKLKDALTRWEKEKPLYSAFAKYSHDLLSHQLLAKSIFCKTSYRSKDNLSLVKKIIRKKYVNGYNDVEDKAGIRCVVRFKKEISLIEPVLPSTFVILEKDDKSASLGIDRLGYQAIHYQIKLLDNFTRDHKEFTNLTAELQVRTMCQDLWSEMAHVLAYKTELQIPSIVDREMHCLSAHMELADNCFENVFNKIAELPDSYPIKILNVLEGHFYNTVGFTYDRLLSIQIIPLIMQCYSKDEANTIDCKIQTFVETNKVKLKIFIDKYRNIYPLVSQPEIFLVLERLENNSYLLVDNWNINIPIDLLNEIALGWGISLE